MPTYTMDQLMDAFRAFDANGDGTISKDEFLKALTRKGPGCSPLDADQARKMWDRFDSNADGALSYEEFARTWGGASMKKAAVVVARPAVPERSEEDWKRLIMEEDFAAFGTTEPGSDASAEASVNRGVTIGFLIDFTNKHDCWKYPTWKVVRDIIRPATEATRVRYTDLPEVRETGAVGRAVTFGSHWCAPPARSASHRAGTGRPVFPRQAIATMPCFGGRRLPPTSARCLFVGPAPANPRPLSSSHRAAALAHGFAVLISRPSRVQPCLAPHPRPSTSQHFLPLLLPSRSWGAQWGVLVSALADHAKRSRLVWLDVFAVRQWPGNTADLAFAGVIARCSSFVIACERSETQEKDLQGRTFAGMTIEQTFAKRVDLLPKEVRAKIAFFRSWCLLEIQTAVAAPNCAVVLRIGEQCDKVISADGCPRFKPDNGMPKALTNLVDIAQAEAQEEEDRIRILSGVQAMPGGVDELNDVVRGVIITSMACGDAPEVLAAAMGDEDVLNIEAGTPAQLQTWASAAAAGGYMQLLAKLLDAGAGPATLDRGMISPLTSAAQSGQAAALELILKRVADPNQPLNLLECGYRGSKKGPTTPGDVHEAVNFQDSDGDCALLLASLNGKTACVRMLLDAGADLHASNACQTTAIKQAADNGHVRTMELLLERGAEVNCKDCDADTPLIGAAESGHLEACKLLFRYGADLHQTNSSGLTAADKAEASDCVECAAWLREQMN